MDDVAFGLSVIAFKCKETIYWIYQEIQNGIMIWIGKQQRLFIGILIIYMHKIFKDFRLFKKKKDFIQIMKHVNTLLQYHTDRNSPFLHALFSKTK